MRKFKSLAVTSLCALALVGCGEDGVSDADVAALLPASFPLQNFGGNDKEFIAKYTKIYGATFHLAKDRNLVPGKIMVVATGDDDYALGFYAKDGGQFILLSDVVHVEDVAEPYASELLSKGVPCVVAAKKDSAVASYYYVLDGKLQVETF